MKRYLILNPITSLDIFKKDATGNNSSFKEKTAPSGLKLAEKDLILGDVYMSIVTLITYPSYVGHGWLGAVANVNHTRMCITITQVINIRSDVLISSGDGTVENPYTLKLK